MNDAVDLTDRMMELVSTYSLTDDIEVADLDSWRTADLLDIFSIIETILTQRGEEIPAREVVYTPDTAEEYDEESYSPYEDL